MSDSVDVRLLAYSLSSRKVLLSMVSMFHGEYLRPEYRALWELVHRCFVNYKEVPTENMLAYAAGESWEQIAETHKEVSGAVVDPREYMVDLEKIKDRYNQQLLLKAGKDVFQRNWDGAGFGDLGEANKVFRSTVSQIDQLRKVNAYRQGTLAGSAGEAWTKYQQTKANPDAAAGIHLGLLELDRTTNGLRDGDLLLIGGESGTGKSALAMNAAKRAWLRKNEAPLDPDRIPCEFEPGRSIVYFTIEMPYEQLEMRFHACLAGVRLCGIRDGMLDAAEEKRYAAALKFLERYPHQFHIVDVPRGATMRYVETTFLELCEDNQDDPPQMVVVDYLNLMSLDDGRGEVGEDWLKIGKIAEQAHEFVRANHVPVVSPAQLNRPPKEESARQARPDQDRLARSLMLAQNASIIINIEKRKDEHLLKDMRVHIVKNRDGEQSVITLQKRLDLMRLYDNPEDWDEASYVPK
jgi:replicative DNA helicase